MNLFDKPQQPRFHDVEEWGHNEKGCYSFTSGRWIPKVDEGYTVFEEGITFPGNLASEVAEEKKERY